MSSNQIMILQGYLNLFLHFPINTLTAQTGGHNLIASLPSKFAQLLLIQHLNHSSESHGRYFLQN
jgi:hypothetical protein